MKRTLSLLLMIFLLLNVGQLCNAEDTGIIIIGDPESEMETVNLDDFKVDDEAEISGYGNVRLTDAGWHRIIEKWNKDTVYNKYGGEWYDIAYYDSGDEALYLRLQFDILNTKKEPYNYYDDFSDIICTYDDEYQFGGWVRQHTKIKDDGKTLVVLNNTAGGWETDMLYRDQFSIVVTLPTDVFSNVISKKKNLNISFMLGENEFNYIYR